LALAIFVLSLADTVPAVDAESDDARAFDRACGSCHDARRGFSGGLILAETLNSDDLAARSAHRGTGYYKVPSLLGAGDGGPYLHDGSVETLADLIDAGHPFGITLSEEDRGAVLRFVSTMRSQP
jgi:mono/diheme cytochrome c family protein